VKNLELAAFLEAPAPRVVPRSLQTAYVGRGWRLGALLGVVVLGTGAMMWAAPEAGVPLALALALMAAGLTAMMTAVVYRRDRIGLLRDGVLEQGTIVAVEPGAFALDGGRRYRVRIRLRYRGERTVHVTIGAPALPDARRLAARGEPVHVLHDPRRPDRAVWLDALV
jgi:uncharacterized protein DUF3592